MEARVHVLEFRECVATSGSIGHKGEGIGWYQLHDGLWCYMDNAPGRANYVWGYVARNLVCSWTAHVGDHSCKTDTLCEAMRFVEDRVGYEMSRI